MFSIIHLLGDSTLDNIYWLLYGDGSNLEQAKVDSVEGQLASRLSSPSELVTNHAYDGFTTSSVLNGDAVGRVLNIMPSIAIIGKKAAYLNEKNMPIDARDFTVHPLRTLQESIEITKTARHYVVISVGGNDFRERLRSPIALIRAIPRIQERYLQILDAISNINNRNIRPILMLQYRVDSKHDHYQIYTVMKVIGAFFLVVQWLSLLGIIASAMALVAKKIDRRWGFASLLICSGIFLFSLRVIPLKVTKSVLKGENVGMATLGALMEAFYRPILARAKADRIPILDLPNTFNPNDSSLYISQIEPSKAGGALIAEGIATIVHEHDFDSVSQVYSKRGADQPFTAVANPGASGWTVAYPNDAR